MSDHQPASVLMPAKFILILGQVLLLALVLEMKSQHIHWGIGDNFGESSDEYKTADKVLVGTCISFIVIMAFEFMLMILGLSLTFDKYNIVQIFIHFLGCLFTAWFLLDSWRYTRIWYIWAFFGIVPFIIEVLIIMSAVRLSKDISLNLKGQFRA